MFYKRDVLQEFLQLYIHIGKKIVYGPPSLKFQINEASLFV